MKYLIPASLLMLAIINGVLLIFAQDPTQAVKSGAFMLLAFYLGVEILKVNLKEWVEKP